MDINWSSAAATGLAAFFVAAVVWPLEAVYRRWKAERGDVPAYRDWRGRWVPDLHLIRMKRAAICAVALFVAFGLVAGWAIMAGPTMAPIALAQ